MIRVIIPTFLKEDYDPGHYSVISSKSEDYDPGHYSVISSKSGSLFRLSEGEL
jgi:hypothetical protein